MSKLGKKTKISIIIVIILPILSALLIGVKHPKSKQEQAEEYILREAKIGLKIYFEKYFNDIDPNSIKLKIKYHRGMTSGPVVEAYVNDDKDLNIDCSVIKLPKDKWETPQDTLGMVISQSGSSEELDNMLKYEYSFDNPNHKSPKRPSELIPKSEVEKAKKDRDLLNYIPDMRTF